MNDDGRVRIERHIAAAPDVVYPYLIDPDLTPRWLGATSFIDPVVGGRFEMTSPNTMIARGTVVETIPDRKVSFTWGWDGHPSLPPGSSLVEIELIPDGEGTLVRLTHSALGPDERTLHHRGWNHYVGRLDSIVSGTDPGPDPGAG